MREKLLDLMKSEGLKPSQLAEMLEINPAGVSHILAGRNKPGFDLLQKILRRFPRINPDWLMLDSDKMYRDEETMQRHSSGTLPTTPQFNADPIGGLFTNPDEPADNSATRKVAQITNTTSEQIPILPAASISSRSLQTDCKIERVLIFYSDGTFDNYTSARE